MKHQRVVIDILVITLAFLIFTIWYRNSIADAEQSTASPFVKFYKIYLITTDKEYQYWQFMNQGAQDMANEIGVSYVWDAPTVRSADRQIEVINKAVDDGADALLVAADDPKLISGAIEDAKARGVKIIYVDSPANEEAITTLATDNYAAGVVAGNAMLSLLNESNIEKGSIGIISVSNKENSDLRDKGFRSAIAADPRFVVLDTVLTNGEPVAAQLAAERVIETNRDLVGLYGTNEGTSVGVGNAIKDNDNKYIGVGYDQTDAMLQLLKEGSIRTIVNQNPYTMGYLGMAQAIAAILGKSTGPEFLNTGVELIK